MNFSMSAHFFPTTFLLNCWHMFFHFLGEMFPFTKRRASVVTGKLKCTKARGDNCSTELLPHNHQL